MNAVLMLWMLATGPVLQELPPPPLPAQVQAEHNAGKRSELAIALADEAIDRARDYYKKGDIARAEAELADVRGLADECLNAAREAHKSRSFKKAEMRVQAIARRVRSLADELGYDQRDTAIRLAEHLESIRDKLLAGVMGK
jgi:hypothetical protein